MQTEGFNFTNRSQRDKEPTHFFCFHFLVQWMTETFFGYSAWAYEKWLCKTVAQRNKTMYNLQDVA